MHIMKKATMLTALLAPCLLLMACDRQKQPDAAISASDRAAAAKDAADTACQSDDTLNACLKAAQQGNAFAQFNLGVMYYTGHGVDQDRKQAAFWYHKAAGQGNASAQNNLGAMYDSEELAVSRDYSQATRSIRPVTDNHEIQRDDSVPLDYTQAVSWYRKAAQQGNAVAQYNLSRMYFSGTGIAQDNKQGLFWLRQSAEHGYGVAQFDLGLRYGSGEGVAVDKKQAEHWVTESRMTKGASDAEIYGPMQGQ